MIHIFKKFLIITICLFTFGCATTKKPPTDNIPPRLSSDNISNSVRGSGEDINKSQKNADVIVIGIDRSLSLNEQVDQILIKLQNL